MTNAIEGGYDRTQIRGGEWFTPSGFIGCCDCGLVHKVITRIRKGKIQMSVYRDPKITRAMRKTRKYSMIRRNKETK